MSLNRLIIMSFFIFWLIIGVQCQADQIWTWSDYLSYRQTNVWYWAVSIEDTMHCSGYLSGANIILDPICLIQPIELIPMPEVVSGVWHYIDYFIWWYQFEKEDFEYTGAHVAWKHIIPNIYQSYDLPRQIQYSLTFRPFFLLPSQFPAQDPWISASVVTVASGDYYHLLALQQDGVRLSIPLLAWYRIQFESYYLAVVERNLREYGRCSKKNYLLAWEALHDLYLLPGQSFTINPLLAGLDGYCQWATPGKYLFYAWVCGVSTQLFRTSLLMPGLTPTERHGHNEWYTKYYGDKVIWDDAAIIDYRKQFTIQNQTKHAILIKWWSQWDSHYLVGLTTHTRPTVRIIKKEIAPLQWQVTKTVLYSGHVTQTGSRTTTYTRKNSDQN